MFQKGSLQDKSIIAQFLIFLVVTIVSISLVSLVSVLMITPLFHVDMLSVMDSMNHMSDPKMINVLKFLQFSQAIGLFVIPALVFSWLHSGDIGSYMNLKAKPMAIYFLYGFLIILCIQPFIAYLSELNQKMSLPSFLTGLEQWMKAKEEDAKNVTDAFLQVKTVAGLGVNMVVVALAAAIGEEFLFRGVLQRMLLEATGRIHLAIVITAIIFSAFHIQFYGFVPRVILGMLLGYLYYFSGSIWVSVLAHFTNNGMALIADYLYRNQYTSFNPDDNTSVPLLAVIVSVLLTTGAIFTMMIRKSRNRLDMVTN